MLVERGERPERLIVAFSGMANKLMMPAFDFFSVAGLLKCSRILLRDETRTAFAAGIPSLADGRAGLVALLREKMRELEPRTVVFVGTSGGGHAALAYGHLLGPDLVHAFSPFTYADAKNIARYGDTHLAENRKDVLDNIAARGISLEAQDLARFLLPHNGRTQYFVHACGASPLDFKRAKHLQNVPKLLVVLYPCKGHGIVRFLVHKKLLMRVLADDPVAWLRQPVEEK
jgi:acetyl esterase/lipase